MREWVRYQESIGQGAVTNSKHPRSHVFGVYPVFSSYAKGSYLHGEDNKHYLDFICGLGTNLFGYNNDRIMRAMNAASTFGASPSLPTRMECECGERLKELFSWVEKWKFLCSGSEACTAATIIARAATGRKLILSEGYHGWHPEFTYLTPPAYGCPPIEYMETFSTMDQIGAHVAGVIIEPDRYTFTQLQDIREICTRFGCFLIFDEVITGFRYKLHSISNASGVRPDLVVIGKAMANGEPISAVGGSGHVMDSPYFVSSTYAGHTRRLAAAMCVVDLLLTVPGYENEYLWKSGEQFLDEFNGICDWIKIKGYATRGAFWADSEEKKALFFQEACKAGFLFGPSWFYNWGHIPQRATVIHTCREICGRIERMEVKLEGQMPVKPLSLMVREKKNA